MRRHLVQLSVGIVLVMNTAVLVSVWLNRRGQPTNLIELTERELPVQLRGAGNSAVFLGVNWHRNLPEPPDRFRGGLDWFDRTKLAAAGFDTSMPLDDPRARVHYRRMRPRHAYVVLEYGGDRWSEWESWHAVQLAQAGSPEERERLERAAEAASRLFAVDAGLNGAELRARYPDQSKFLIVPASIQVVAISGPDGKLRDLQGNIQHLLVSQIYVPPAFASLFRSIRPEDTMKLSYRVVVRYGSRYEPQILELHQRQKSSHGGAPSDRVTGSRTAISNSNGSSLN